MRLSEAFKGSAWEEEEEQEEQEDEDEEEKEGEKKKTEVAMYCSTVHF